MSFPRKRRNWRAIEVNGQQFRWRFSARETGTVALQAAASSGRLVLVAMPQWRDPWLFFGAPGLPANTPPIVTARFARGAILFALSNGWSPHERGPALRATFRDGQFVAL